MSDMQNRVPVANFRAPFIPFKIVAQETKLSRKPRVNGGDHINGICDQVIILYNRRKQREVF